MQAMDTDSGQDKAIVSRLDRLELLLSRQQREFKQERLKWVAEEKTLREQMETLREKVATFNTENEELKNDIKFLRQEQRALMEENLNLERRRQGPSQ